MAGSPPPEDAPSPEAQDQSAVDASFEPTDSGISLCGFAIPGFAFNLAFNIPFPPAFDFPPPFSLPLAIPCPLALAEDAPDGGGRVGDLGLDADPEFG